MSYFFSKKIPWNGQKMIDKQGKFWNCTWLKKFSANLIFENVKFTFWHPVEWICDEWLRKLWYLILQAEEENISTCRRPTIRFSLTSNRGECIIIQKRFFPRWLKICFLITVLEILTFSSTHILCKSYLVIIRFWKWSTKKVRTFQIDLT